MLSLSTYINLDNDSLAIGTQDSFEQPHFAPNSYLGNIGAPLSSAHQVREHADVEDVEDDWSEE